MSTEYCNLTKFSQDWTENKNFLSEAKNVVRTPFLKNNASSSFILYLFPEIVMYAAIKLMICIKLT